MTCSHLLGPLPCVNTHPHPGNGHGCIHISGSFVDDRHNDGGHG